MVLVVLLSFGGCATNSEIGRISRFAETLVPDKEVVYKTIDRTKLKLHLFTPVDWKASDNRAAVVFFFGGAWSGGTPTQFYPHCEYLASRGMVAMAAEYRVRTRNHTTPRESVKDGKSAVRWIRQHARSLGVDPDRIVASGGSAGGQVAAATGNLPGFEEAGEDLGVSSRPDALVLFNPVFDNGPEGFGYQRVKDYWEEFSPMHNISKASPPTLVLLGTKDKLVPVETGLEYQRMMDAAGAECDLQLYKGRGHGFFNVKKRRDFAKTVNAMDGFLVALGFLEARSDE
jgi:acetyl esterase/lipase